VEKNAYQTPKIMIIQAIRNHVVVRIGGGNGSSLQISNVSLK